MYTLTLLEDHPTPAWNRKNNLIIDIMRETVRLENNNTWTVLLVLWIKHVIGCNHFINTHMALCWKYKDQMARSGLRWNEMGVCSLETNYLAHMDYTKFTGPQEHIFRMKSWLYVEKHHSQHEEKEYLIGLPQGCAAWEVGGGYYCTGAQAWLHPGITSRVFLKTINALGSPPEPLL